MKSFAAKLISHTYSGLFLDAKTTTIILQDLGLSQSSEWCPSRPVYRPLEAFRSPILGMVARHYVSVACEVFLLHDATKG